VISFPDSGSIDNVIARRDSRITYLRVARSSMMRRARGLRFTVQPFIADRSMPRCNNATETEIALVDRADTDADNVVTQGRAVLNAGQIGRFMITANNYADILAAQDIRRG